MSTKSTQSTRGHEHRVLYKILCKSSSCTLALCGLVRIDGVV